MKHIAVLLFVTLPFCSSCSETARDIHSENYSGRVYKEKPNEKDSGRVPSNNEISSFENQLQKELPKLISESADTILKKNGAKILADLPNYKRRYYSVTTIEKQEMLIVEFLHPDSFSNEHQWKDSLWSPKKEDYTFFKLHYYPAEAMLFNLTRFH